MLEKIKDMYYQAVSYVESRKGQTLVEYALILVLVALTVFVALQFLAGRVGNTYNNAAARLPY